MFYIFRRIYKGINKVGAIFVIQGFIITSKETLVAEWNNLYHFTPNIFLFYRLLYIFPVTKIT